MAKERRSVPPNLASCLFAVGLVAAIALPGYAAYIGAYLSIVAAGLAVPLQMWREPGLLVRPAAIAIWLAVLLVAATVPFTFRGEADLLAPVFVAPMLAAIPLAVVGYRAAPFPGARMFAALCLLAALLALLGGGYEAFVLDVRRPGLGTNPIHFGSFAALAGGMALIGVVADDRPSRFVFLAGPILGLGAAIISDSRGPTLSAFIMAAVGLLILLILLWQDRLFRAAALAAIGVGGAGATALIASGDSRIATVIDSALNIFHFTGTYDDIRVGLYASAIETFKTSPVFGVGMGQMMASARAMFPRHAELAVLENLHADWANFLAMSGLMGLTAWLLLLAAPLLLLFNDAARRDRPILLGVILLTVGQLALGVSNTTFGLLPQTMIYAASLAYLFARAERLRMHKVVS
jgi:O-antigen ligase